jgi:hypothetical protein
MNEIKKKRDQSQLGPTFRTYDMNHKARHDIKANLKK